MTTETEKFAHSFASLSEVRRSLATKKSALATARQTLMGAQAIVDRLSREIDSLEAILSIKEGA